MKGRSCGLVSGSPVVVACVFGVTCPAPFVHMVSIGPSPSSSSGDLSRHSGCCVW